MKVNIIGKHNLKITEAMETTAKSKVEFLNKYLKEDTQVTLTVSIDKNIHKIEILFPYQNQIVKNEISTNDFYEGIDKLIPVLKNNMSKMHDIKISKNKKKIGLDQSLINDVENLEEIKGKIIKRKNFSMKPMLEEEAILQMKLLGHASFMFINADADFTMCLLYQRKDGNFGLIKGVYEDED